RINAKTGVRARPGDEDVIWESFLDGTEPGDDMYILNESGISLLPSYGYHAYDVNNGDLDAQTLNPVMPQGQDAALPPDSTGSGLY
ncbi:MAG: hypothetical protein ACLFRA_02825, partial [Alphaproteobacteria bacterium]